MRATLLPAKPTFLAKPCIRKHPSSEKIIDDQQEDKRYRFDPSSKKAQSSFYSCLIVFFFISVVLFLCCNYHDPSSIASSLVTPSPFRGTEGEAPAAHREALELANPPPPSTSALRGLGTTFRHGTKAMSELVVAHISEHTLPNELCAFMRTLHRSGMTGHADVVLLLPWSTLPEAMVSVINEEEDHFRKLLSALSNGSMVPLHYSNGSISSFNINGFHRAANEGESGSQPIWGSANANVVSASSSRHDLEFKWGAIVGFDVSELNPDDTFRGFIDHPPLQLRRWACYQMLLGMVRRHFKHILLIGVEGSLILGDILASTRKRAGLYLGLEDRNWGTSIGKLQSVNNIWQDIALDHLHEQITDIRPPSLAKTNHDARSMLDQAQQREMLLQTLHETGSTVDFNAGKHSTQPNMLSLRARRRQLSRHGASARKSSNGRRRRRHKLGGGGLYEHVYGKKLWSSLEDAERMKKLVNSRVIVGGMQQVRGLANAMVTEIVKVALERKNREPFPDNVLLSYLIHKSSGLLGKRVMDHLHLMENGESFLHSLAGSRQPSLFWRKNKQPYGVVIGCSKSKLWSNVIDLAMKDICRLPVDAQVYSDCLKSA